MFAETLRDHNANVQKWRAAEKELRGKTVSPTTNAGTTAPAAKARAVVRTVPAAKAPPADTSPEAAVPEAKQKR